MFTGDFTEALAVALPGPEEVDRAVLPALDHLHRTGMKRDKAAQGGVSKPDRVSSSRLSDGSFKALARAHRARTRGAAQQNEASK